MHEGQNRVPGSIQGVYRKGIKWVICLYLVSQARLSSESPACETSHYSSHIHSTISMEFSISNKFQLSRKMATITHRQLYYIAT